MNIDLIEYMDFVMGFLTCMALSLTVYLILSRKKK
mgnify:CR=1 FL=1